MPVQPARAPSSPRKITPRELEVLALIAEGYSTREIAQMLWITDETVRTHVRRLLGPSRGANARARVCDRVP